MTKQESQAVHAAIAPMYNFMRKSMGDAEYHEGCKFLYQQCLAQIAPLEDKPKAPPAPKNETTANGRAPIGARKAKA